MNSQIIHVLLIEDNAEHVAMLQELMSKSPAGVFELTHADSLAAGLERLKQGGVELILLDLSLGESEGLATFVRTMEAAPNLPIVVLSGTDDVHLALETVKLGAQDYLVKGHVDNDLLVRAMQYALERKRVQLELKQAYDQLEQRVEKRTAQLQQANIRLQKQIVEQRRAEEETLESNRQLANALSQLRTAQQQIIQRERMHALGRMANGIAHDFNNSLAPILGFSELLLIKPEVLADPQKVRSYVAMINTAAKDSANVVNRLREFYRHRDESEIFGPVVVNDLVREVIAVTQPRWKNQALAAGVNITMCTELGDVPKVAGNESELREALTNILFNAIEAIRELGTITIRTEVQGDWLAVTIADDGIGMAEDVRVRCLEPFYSTKENQGIGLGLGSVYGIIRRHEGQIDIQSAPGRGTAVTLLLPLERDSNAPAAAKATSRAGTALRILVVEDEPLVREVVTIYLLEDGHLVTTAENGREALEKYQPGAFDLVMTDRAMPEMNGDQLAKAIKQLAPDQPLILLTGFGDLMSGAGERPEGVDLVVSKPFTLDMLRAAIAKSVRR